jgi:hypothetical protein
LHVNHGEPILSRNHIENGVRVAVMERDVPEVVILGKQLAKPLNKRRRVTVELPEFAIRAIHRRVDEANAGDEEGEQVTFNDVVE